MNKLLKRGLILGSVLIVISCITIYCTVDIKALTMLSTFNMESILLAVIALSIGMYFDGLRLQRLVRIGGYHLPIKAVLRVIFGNYFMALLTPGASGGAVAQVLILKSYGVPIAKATPIVLIRTIFSILFLIIMMPFIFLHDTMTIPYISKDMLWKLSLLLVLCVCMGIYFLKTELCKRLVYRLARYIKKNNPNTWLIKLEEINSGFALLYEHPIQSFIVFIESGISLLCLYCIAPALMWAFSTTTLPVVMILERMILLNLILYFAPTPGGTGIAEGLFVFLLASFVPDGTIGLIAVGWRVIAEYIPFFIGMYAVLTLYGKQFVAGTVTTSDKL